MAKAPKSSDFKKAIQRRLAAYRERSNMSQAQFAKYLGITKDRYAKYETRSTLPAEYWPAACARLNVTAWFLLTGNLVEEHMQRRSGEVAARSRPTKRRGTSKRPPTGPGHDGPHG